ncbi:Bacterial extracellular solute-binding protein [uncultured archaeon]|nr:Bacterial extracellular solute-binding protein [uncultured archaeon]
MIDGRIIAALLAAMVFATTTGLCDPTSKEINVFCAAGLTGAFSEIGQIYKNETNVNVILNFDGAQVLRTQIENGAYADVLVSGSNKHMQALMAEGFMDNGTVSTFARNWQAIVVPKNNPANIANFSDLDRPGIKIVMGSKDLPITDITMQILDKIAKDPAYGPEYKEKVLANKISEETNINFIVSKVAMGEADAAFAHKSEISSKYAEKVILIDIPERYNVKSDYTIGVLNQSKYKDLAHGFIDLISSPQARAVLEKHGFEIA